MAGSYPDVPDNRVAYDLDGTVVIYTSGTSVTQYGSDTARNLNDESAGAVFGFPFNSVAYVGFIFPQVMDINGLYVSYSYLWDGSIWSPNTTTGVDGDWYGFSFSPGGDYRNNIQPVSLTEVKALRFGQHDWSYDSYFRLMHFYGHPSAGASIDKLEIWHPTLDQQVDGAFFDWGDTPRNSTDDKFFRVKNLSETNTANDVSVYFDAPTDTTPSWPGMHLMSINSGSFLSTVDIPILYPGQISDVITLRKAVDPGAILGRWVFRIIAEATTWT